MATRFYLAASGSPPVTPPALPTGWITGSPVAVQALASTTKTDTVLTDLLVGETTALTVNIPVGIYVSDELGAQSISGTVSMVVRGVEGGSASDDALQVGLYLISGDGTTVLSTLYGGHTAALNTTSGALGQEIASAAQQTRIIPAQAVTGQTAGAGDRLMILVGYRTYDLSATVRNSTLRLGDPVAVGDQALTSGLTTDLVPWVELSADVVFDTGGPATVDLVPAEFALTAVAVTPVPQPVTVNLTPAAMTLTAVPVSPVPQPVAVALAPAAMTLTAVPVTPVPQPVTVTLVQAEFTLTAVPVTVSATGGTVTRPYTGTVTRPNSGTVTRPYTGVVTRP